MKIGDREINTTAGTYVIAELGVNHDGSVERAIELVNDARASGADAIKLQYFETDRLLSSAAKLAGYQSARGATDAFSMLRRLELDLDAMSSIASVAHDSGLHAIVTVFSVELVERAMTVPWDAFKTASPDVIHRPLLDALSSTGLPMIVSTGASTPDEVARTMHWMEKSPCAFLQCVSAYPCPAAQAAVEGIVALRTLGATCVGYSDHTVELDTGARAVERGAVLLEKHLTYDRHASGPDHAASLDAAGFRVYVDQARAARALSDDAFFEAKSVKLGWKGVLPIEEDVRHVARQSITTTRPLTEGAVITRDDITFKRPGVGLEPWQYTEVVGRRTRVGIAPDTPITGDMLA